MGRHTNPLLQLLLNDEEAKKKFVEIVCQYGTSRGLWDYFQINTFYGEDYSHLRRQTLLNIIRRLGFRGRRGRPTRSTYGKNIPRFIQK